MERLSCEEVLGKGSRLGTVSARRPGGGAMTIDRIRRCLVRRLVSVGREGVGPRDEAALRAACIAFQILLRRWWGSRASSAISCR